VIILIAFFCTFSDDRAVTEALSDLRPETIPTLNY